MRAGAVLPLLPRDVDALGSFGDGKGLVTLEERRRELELIAFPRGRSSSRFGDKGRISSSEGKGIWRIRIRGGRAREFALQASLATLRGELEPCQVRVDGRRLAGRRWSFDRSVAVLDARFRGRSPVLTASERDCRR